MTTVADVCRFLDDFAPPRLAEEWDNVGLLVGDGGQTVERLMTCLTITPASAAEAVRERAQMIVTHHPLPFKPLRRLTTASTPGRILLDLIRAGVAVHSPHTAFDSAAAGINEQLATGIGLDDVRPLLPAVTTESDQQILGSGRFGSFAQTKTLGQIAAKLKQFLKTTGLQVVGDLDRPIDRAAVACGSGGSLLSPAIDAGCQLFISGEASFHTCLEAEASGVCVLLCGHYASERFAVEHLAGILGQQFPAITSWASRDERDPLRWIANA